MKPPAFRYVRPETLPEAVALLTEHGDDARPLAGGQSLLPMLNLRLAAPAVLVDINRLPALDAIEGTADGLTIGALVPQRALERSAQGATFGALADGLPLVGHVATRNRGTVGGSIAHADPAAELPLALLALGGSVVVEGPDGRRAINADELFAGFLTTTLRPGELVVEVRFPRPQARESSALLEVAQRHGDFPLAAVALALRLDDEGRIVIARLAAGAVADRPLLLPEAAKALVAGESAEAAGRVAAGEVDPAGSLHAPAGYQRHLVSVLVARAVERARHRAGHPSVPGVTRTPGRARTAGRWSGAAGRCTVNGRPVSLEGVPDRRLLSDFLRHDLGLRGTHVGCEHGVCGACTVRVDGVAVRSCLLLARQAEGADIATVEGLAADDETRTLHPLQEAFRRHFALQCGFCTAGILMAATERLDETAGAVAGPPAEDEIRRLLSGHLCRCTGYEPIVAAIAEVRELHLPPPSPRLREDPAS
jgi:CO/xanthine dehydrogenase FAD-binding subunit/aerobic-type carbon monoxide dehydrogenase small subunit (CoxS/CutS family)